MRARDETLRAASCSVVQAGVFCFFSRLMLPRLVRKNLVEFAGVREGVNSWKSRPWREKLIL